jgi:hypothetical protein
MLRDTEQDDKTANEATFLHVCRHFGYISLVYSSTILILEQPGKRELVSEHPNWMVFAKACFK